MRNARYFVREALTLIRLGLGRSILSVLCLTILLLFSLVSLTVWTAASHYVEQMKQETMIAVYYTPELNEHSLFTLERQIQATDGVRGTLRISREESAAEMAALLGEEADILARFAENPFEAYLRVSVDPSFDPERAGELRKLSHVTYVRDHRDVLTKVRQISDVAGGVGLLTVTAAVASVIMITYFMTAESVHAHRQQIVDLRLMGAPESFLTIPFLLQGLITNVFASLVAGVIFFAGMKMLPLELGFGGAVLWDLSSRPAFQLMLGIPAVGLLSGLRAVSSKRNFA